MKLRDFKTHATYFNILSPVSELSDYLVYSLLIQGFLFGKFVRVRGLHGNAYYAGKYSKIVRNCTNVAARALIVGLSAFHAHHNFGSDRQARLLMQRNSQRW